MLKRILCILLSCFLLLGFAACAKEEPPQSTQTDSASIAVSEESDAISSETVSETQSETSPGTNAKGEILQSDEILEVPRINYSGYEIRILHKTISSEEMYAEDRVGELINDAVYDRNRFVENYLGVKLVFDAAEVYQDKVDAAVGSGYDMYHIISNLTYQAPALIQRGSFLDINAIPKEQNAIDLTKRWWNQSFHREAVLNNQLYLLEGDITTTSVDWAEVIFYNNDLLKAYVGEDIDLLQTVYDMDWTYETFLNYVNKVGDGNDTGEWGFCPAGGSYALDGLVMGMAMDLIYRDSRNYPNISLNTPRNLEIGTRLRQLFQSNPSVNYEENQNTEEFSSGKALFYMGVMVQAGKSLRASGIDYAIIPPPLYDEFQAEYRIVPQDNYSSLSILCHVQTGLSVTTQVLEVMGSESYINLRHCIQEKCYKQRYLKTEPKGRMFDYVVDSIYFDFGYTYGQVLNKPVMLMRNYARYAPGDNDYMESLTERLTAADISSATALEEFLKPFFKTK